MTISTEQTAAIQRAAEDISFAWDAASKLALIPPERRPEALARIAPVLQERFPQEDLSRIDLSDAGLKQRLAAYDELLAQLRSSLQAAASPPVAHPPKKGGRKALSSMHSPYRARTGASLISR